MVGRLIMRLAESDDAFAAQLRGILDRGVTDRHERLALGLDEIARRGGRGRRRADADRSAPAEATPTDMPERLP
jgi:hypothetical protein